MNFFNPFALLFLGFIPLIILLYLLKLRRRPVTVPSIMLWQRAVRDMEANAPFQRLRKNLLLLLQILIVLLLALVLARPFFKSEATDLENVIIVIDISASMQAKDLGKSRFDAAKNRAMEIISGLADEDHGMIIVAGKMARVVVNFTNDKNRLKSAVRSLKVADSSANMRDALILASSLLSLRSGQIFVLSDGGSEDLTGLKLGNISITYVSMGQSSENVGITALDVRKSTVSKLDYQVFVTMRNYGGISVDGNLEFYVDENLVDVRPIKIKGRSAKSQLFENFGFRSGIITVKLDVKDFLAVDNVAYSLIPEDKPSRVLLVTDENYFLEKALNLDPNVLLFRISFADYQPSANYDVTVFDGKLPALLPPGNFLILNAPIPAEIGTTSGFVNTPQILDWRRTHPIMRFVELGDVQIAKTRKINLKSGAEILAEAKETALIIAHRDPRRNIVYVGFDLFDSNLPLRISFPIFVANTLQWLINRGEENATGQIRTGSIYPIYFPSDISSATITTPNGERSKIKADQNPIRFSQTDQIGIYQVQMEDSTTIFVANLLDENESNIKPRQQLAFGKNNTISGTSKVKINKEFWRWLAFLALGVLLLEWWVYHRRVGV